MTSLELLILFIFLVIIVIIIYAVICLENPINNIIPFVPITPPPLAPVVPVGPSTPTTDCARFAVSVAKIGEPNGPTCPTGSQIWAGQCYKNIWSVDGGTKTATCRINYGSYGGVQTKCGVGVYNLDYGAPCPAVDNYFGPGYHKTAVCTCQFRGVVTGAANCKPVGPPNVCPTGWDFFGGACYQTPCPANAIRTGPCTCTVPGR
jgi:hypothetical protein